jgi:curved DNA-binding protein CbpA
MKSPTTADPFHTLGLPRDADETEVRARYLELVKQFPPDREPEKFREIRSAFEACKDPLSIARRLVRPPDDADVPEWAEAIETQKRNPPRLSPAFLLSLGNRSADDRRNTAAGEGQTASEGRTKGAHPSARDDAP